jgi:hypothetical protein
VHSIERFPRLLLGAGPARRARIEAALPAFQPHIASKHGDLQRRAKAANLVEILEHLKAVPGGNTLSITFNKNSNVFDFCPSMFKVTVLI